MIKNYQVHAKAVSLVSAAQLYKPAVMSAMSALNEKKKIVVT